MGCQNLSTGRQLPPGGSPHYDAQKSLQSSKPFDTRHTLSHHRGSPNKKNTNQRASDCKVFSFCNRRQNLVLKDSFKSSLAFTWNTKQETPQTNFLPSQVVGIRFSETLVITGGTYHIIGDQQTKRTQINEMSLRLQSSFCQTSLRTGAIIPSSHHWLSHEKRNKKILLVSDWRLSTQLPALAKIPWQHPPGSCVFSLIITWVHIVIMHQNTQNEYCRLPRKDTCRNNSPLSGQSTILVYLPTAPPNGWAAHRYTNQTKTTKHIENRWQHKLVRRWDKSSRSCCNSTKGRLAPPPHQATRPGTTIYSLCACQQAGWHKQTARRWPIEEWHRGGT